MIRRPPRSTLVERRRQRQMCIRDRYNIGSCFFSCDDFPRHPANKGASFVFFTCLSGGRRNAPLLVEKIINHQPRPPLYRRAVRYETPTCHAARFNGSPCARSACSAVRRSTRAFCWVVISPASPRPRWHLQRPATVHRASRQCRGRIALSWLPVRLSLIHISEPTRRTERSRMPSSA